MRQRIAQLATAAEVARALGRASSCAASSRQGKPPTVEASQYKLFATSSRSASPRCARHRGRRARSCAWTRQDAPVRGPLRGCLPRHGDRDDRRRLVRDPEEHHRAAPARPAEELLSPCATRPRAARRRHGARPLHGRARGALHAHPRRLRRARGEGRRAAEEARRADRAGVLDLRARAAACSRCGST